MRPNLTCRIVQCTSILTLPCCMLVCERWSCAPRCLTAWDVSCMLLAAKHEDRSEKGGNDQTVWMGAGYWMSCSLSEEPWRLLVLGPHRES
ncbi:hypothetical protein K505DRAFT_146011 [Melanomma pulvis-pyrius CBS 109.77]|uniref:Secreted protein n=1 Tax=Melanomma pulvis-pyrius CBS 109.77 TaxID=1314802 RepID=A0A6A6XMD2_9PLEO|nr:hypothetical protein K505DRAFT_146011 [Melanomma pulvis-pyrius CBS 109.77]